MSSQLLLIDNVALASTSLLCEKAVNNVGAEVDADSNAEQIFRQKLKNDHPGPG